MLLKLSELRNPKTLNGYPTALLPTPLTILVTNNKYHLYVSALNLYPFVNETKVPGWYEIYNTKLSSDSIILNINTYCNNADTYLGRCSYQLSISITYNNITITLLSGSYNMHKFIDKIRVITDTNNSYYSIYMYYTRSNYNYLLVSGFGRGYCQIPTLISKLKDNEQIITTYELDSGLTSNNNKLITNSLTPIILDNDIDLNDIKDYNFTVYIGQTGNNIKNKPNNIDGFHLLVYSSKTDYICQIITNTTTLTIARRFYISHDTKWTNWSKFVTETIT